MKNIIGHFLFSIFILLMLIMQGCKEENTIISSGLGSLYDPAVKPSVIFTFPANNEVGPFSGIFSGEDNYGYPHFKIQFNKIMKSEMMNEEKITISGFDEPVTVYSSSYSTENGVYQFRVQKKNNSDYYSSLPIYRLGKTYTVTVSASLEDMHNQVLGKSYAFSFTMGNSFKVTSATPKDSFATGANEVKLTFNSQVDTNIFSKINIAPALSGYWYLSNFGTAVTFYPATSFTSNTTYTITVAANAKDKFGNALGVPYSYSFRNGEFKMENSYPSNGQTNVSLTNNFSFYSNTSFLYSSLATAFVISPSVSGNFQISGNYFSFQPSEPLKEKTSYTVTLNTSLSSTNGNKLKDPYVITFTTEGLRVYQYYPYYSNASRYSNIEVQFNSPLDTATVKAGFSISPTITGKIYFSNKNRTMIFKPDSIMAANTQYNYAFSTALKSALGNALENSYSYSFITGD